MQQATSYPSDIPLPRVRNVEVVPVDQDGSRMFYVRDPLEIAPQPLLVGPAGVFILSQLDGRRTIDEILESVRKALPGGGVGVGEVQHVLGKLSECCYLDDHVASARIAQVCEAFENSDVRPAWHAGTAYPSDPGELAGMLDGFFAAASSEKARDGCAKGDPTTGLAAIMCPHIDLRAGGKTYPPAFTALADAAVASRPFDLYVILGVAHNGGTEPGKSFAIATGKHYETPFGRVASNGRIIDDWSRRAGRDVTQQQWMHRTEHSVEFALLFLQYIQARSEPAAVRNRTRPARQRRSRPARGTRTPCGPPKLRPNSMRCGRRYLPAASAPSMCSAWTWRISAPNSATRTGSMMRRPPPASPPTVTCSGTRNDSMQPDSSARCRPTETAGTWTLSPVCSRSTRFCQAPYAAAICSATGRTVRRIPVPWSAMPAWPFIRRRRSVSADCALSHRALSPLLPCFSHRPLLVARYI